MQSDSSRALPHLYRSSIGPPVRFGKSSFFFLIEKYIKNSPAGYLKVESSASDLDNQWPLILDIVKKT